MLDIRQVMDDDARFERLYREHASSVRAYARRRLTSEALADDVVFDVFLVVWRRLDEVPPEPRPWLYGIARRALANRRRGEHRTTALRERITREWRDDAADVPGEDGRVRRALARLSDPDRELLLLVAWEGLGPSELAQALGARSGTIAVDLHRARHRLTDALAAEDRLARGSAAAQSCAVRLPAHSWSRRRQRRSTRGARRRSSPSARTAPTSTSHLAPVGGGHGSPRMPGAVGSSSLRVVPATPSAGAPGRSGVCVGRATATRRSASPPTGVVGGSTTRPRSRPKTSTRRPPGSPGRRQTLARRRARPTGVASGGRSGRRRATPGLAPRRCRCSRQPRPPRRCR